MKSENKNKNKVSVRIIPDKITILRFNADIIPATMNTPVTASSAIKAIITQVRLSIKICVTTTAILLSPNSV